MPSPLGSTKPAFSTARSARPSCHRHLSRQPRATAHLLDQLFSGQRSRQTRSERNPTIRCGPPDSAHRLRPRRAFLYLRVQGSLRIDAGFAVRHHRHLASQSASASRLPASIFRRRWASPRPIRSTSTNSSPTTATASSTTNSAPTYRSIPSSWRSFFSSICTSSKRPIRIVPLLVGSFHDCVVEALRPRESTTFAAWSKAPASGRTRDSGADLLSDQRRPGPHWPGIRRSRTRSTGDPATSKKHDQAILKGAENAVADDFFSAWRKKAMSGASAACRRRGSILDACESVRAAARSITVNMCSRTSTQRELCQHGLLSMNPTQAAWRPTAPPTVRWPVCPIATKPVPPMRRKRCHRSISPRRGPASGARRSMAFATQAVIACRISPGEAEPRCCSFMASPTWPNRSCTHCRAVRAFSLHRL